MSDQSQLQGEGAPAERPLRLTARSIGPATEAARRTPAERAAARARPYALPDTTDATGDAIVLAATRAMLTATSRQQVAAILHTAVNDLGAGVVPARLADGHPHAVPLDVSLGVGEPRVVVVDPVSLGAMRCSHQLPGLVEDALLTASRCDAAQVSAGKAADNVGDEEKA